MNSNQKKALEAGRKRAAKKRRRAAVKRVVAFCDYTKREAQLTSSGLTLAQVREKIGRCPDIPTDHEFSLARDEGAKRFDGTLI